jgi:hypothetical protein
MRLIFCEKSVECSRAKGPSGPFCALRPSQPKLTHIAGSGSSVCGQQYGVDRFALDQQITGCRIFINDVALQDILGPIEAKLGGGGAGQYTWLPPAVALFPSQHLLGNRSTTRHVGRGLGRVGIRQQQGGHRWLHMR